MSAAQLQQKSGTSRALLATSRAHWGCYVALGLADIGAIASVVSQMSDTDHVAWFERDYLHITICFIGWVSQDEAHIARALVDEQAVHVPETIRLNGTVTTIGPDLSPRVVALVQQSDALTNLRAKIVSGLRDRRLRVTGGQFIPHVSLGRLNPSGGRPALAASGDGFSVEVTDCSVLASQESSYIAGHAPRRDVAIAAVGGIVPRDEKAEVMDADALLRRVEQSLLDAGVVRAELDRIDIVLAGSAAFGSSDMSSDLDFHLLMQRSHLDTLTRRLGHRVVIDDKTHYPPLFGVLRPLAWLEHRLRHQLALYYWIYTHAVILRDADGQVAALIDDAARRFDASVVDAVRDHYVRYRATRNALASTLRRNDHVAANLVRAETIALALQTVSLALGHPYPYRKWLAWHVNGCGDDGAATVAACERLLGTSDALAWRTADRHLRDHVVSVVAARYPDEPWIPRWWEFVEN